MTPGKPIQRVHIAGIAEDVHGHDAPGGRGDAPLNRRRVHVPGGGVGIHENRLRAAVADGQRRSDHGEIRDDDFISRADAQCAQGQMEGNSPVADGNTVTDAAIFGKRPLKGGDIAPGGGYPAAADRIGDVFQLVARKHGLADGKEARHGGSPIF